MELYHGSIVYSPSAEKLAEYTDSYLAVEGGVVEGIYPTVPESLRGAPITELGQNVLIPAFSDLHVHAPQYPQRGLAMDELLPDTDEHKEYKAWLKATRENQLKLINEHFWEDDRFRRGYTQEGAVIGSKHDPEAAMWLNPQSWCVISEAATKEQAEKSMETVYQQLNTPNGIELMTPCYRQHAFDGAAMLLFNPTTKENGGIFCQAQGWAILAEALLGHGDRAFTYFKESCPAAYNDRAEVREVEPYVHSQFIEGHETPQPGRAHVHWLTGTASTVMVGMVEGILGLRPTPDGLRISPAIPAAWDGFTMEKTFRGKRLHITVDNKAHHQGGESKTLLNGREIPGGLLTDAMLKDGDQITVVM